MSLALPHLYQYIINHWIAGEISNLRITSLSSEESISRWPIKILIMQKTFRFHVFITRPLCLLCIWYSQRNWLDSQCETVPQDDYVNDRSWKQEPFKLMQLDPPSCVPVFTNIKAREMGQPFACYWLGLVSFGMSYLPRLCWIFAGGSRKYLG